MKKGVLVLLLLGCFVGLYSFFETKHDQYTLLQQRILRNKSITINYDVILDTHIQDTLREKTTTLPKLQQMTTKLSGDVVINMHEKTSQGKHRIMFQGTGSEESLHLQAQLNHIISSGMYIELANSVLHQDPLQYNELFLLHNFIKSYHQTRIQRNNSTNQAGEDIALIFGTGQSILQHKESDPLQYNIIITPQNSSRKSQNYTLSGDFQYLSLLSGSIKGDIILSPKEKEQISAPHQFLKRESIINLLQKGG